MKTKIIFLAAALGCSFSAARAANVETGGSGEFDRLIVGAAGLKAAAAGDAAEVKPKAADKAKAAGIKDALLQKIVASFEAAGGHGKIITASNPFNPPGPAL
ncbi:MAG: hypothetical protein NTY45_00925 [Elusimicrobia bacterium]|nr:hypothetical protein [Elusimicrobiota bacterium]